MDFTLKTFRTFLGALLDRNYRFVMLTSYLEHSSVQQNSFNSFAASVKDQQFINSPNQEIIILRHDVDLHPQNALQTALIEHELEIKGTYYFRVVPKSFNLRIMQKIAGLGH